MDRSLFQVPFGVVKQLGSHVQVWRYVIGPSHVIKSDSDRTRLVQRNLSPLPIVEMHTTCMTAKDLVKSRKSTGII